MPLSAAHRATRSRVSKRELAAAGQAGEGTGAIVLAAGERGELIAAPKVMPCPSAVLRHPQGLVLPKCPGTRMNRSQR